MTTGRPSKTLPNPPETISPFSKLLATHQKLNLESYNDKISQLENLSLRELIFLMDELHILNSHLLSLKSDLEITLTKQIGWKETELLKKFQKPFSPKKNDVRSKFQNEVEYNKIKDCYVDIITSLSDFSNAENLIPRLLAAQLRKEDALALALANKPRDFAEEHHWMNEDFAKFIGQQFKILSGVNYMCLHSQEKELSEFLISEDTLNKKQEAIGQYLDDHKTGLFYNIVSVLKKEAESHNSNPWISDENLKDIVNKFNEKSCSDFFNSKPSHMIHVVNFLDEKKSDASLQDQQIIVNYYLARTRDKKNDRLKIIIEDVKKLAQKPKRSREASPIINHDVRHSEEHFLQRSKSGFGLTRHSYTKE